MLKLVTKKDYQLVIRQVITGITACTQVSVTPIPSCRAWKGFVVVRPSTRFMTVFENSVLFVKGRDAVLQNFSLEKTIRASLTPTVPSHEELVNVKPMLFLTAIVGVVSEKNRTTTLVPPRRNVMISSTSPAWKGYAPVGYPPLTSIIKFVVVKLATPVHEPRTAFRILNV